MSDPKMRMATPPRCNADLIVGVVGAYERNFPHLKPPMFHADDVLPMLAGDDAQYETAAALLDAGRVFYLNGEPDA